MNKTQKELTETLVTRALANDHSQFIFLTSPLDLKAAWRVKKSLKSVEQIPKFLN